MSSAPTQKTTKHRYTGKYAEMAKQFRTAGVSEDMIYHFIQQEKESDEFHKNDGTTEIEAYKKWKAYPDEAKDLWLSNAFCPKCGNTSFAPGYNLRIDKDGTVIIQGRCATCGEPIARVCD